MSTPAPTFTRHLGEMTLAMFLGMFAFGAVVGAAGFGSLRLTQPEVFMLGMGAAMSITMVAWMRHRRHSWRLCWEMTAAMFVPMAAVFAFYWSGAISADPICPVSCVLMIPAMAAALAFSDGVRGARRHGRGRVRSATHSPGR